MRWMQKHFHETYSIAHLLNTNSGLKPGDFITPRRPLTCYPLDPTSSDIDRSIQYSAGLSPVKPTNPERWRILANPSCPPLLCRSLLYACRAGRSSLHLQHGPPPAAACLPPAIDFAGPFANSNSFAAAAQASYSSSRVCSSRRSQHTLSPPPPPAESWRRARASPASSGVLTHIHIALLATDLRSPDGLPLPALPAVASTSRGSSTPHLPFPSLPALFPVAYPLHQKRFIRVSLAAAQIEFLLDNLIFSHP
ncbi:hypothetical protein C2845_PM06G20580 [Panicum miliaceum]|uniref:Uncharacterized protein n=1 Tax=Panicum miliaceum TaxID=4540 RepID=A0A3L6RDB0_PANMI|nr:hypothetical protein C2845_PM06G20580 [Panicum miliaceum]